MQYNFFSTFCDEFKPAVLELCALISSLVQITSQIIFHKIIRNKIFCPKIDLTQFAFGK